MKNFSLFFMISITTSLLWGMEECFTSEDRGNELDSYEDIDLDNENTRPPRSVMLSEQTLQEWVQEVKKQREAEAVENHLINLCGQFGLLTVYIEKGEFDTAFEAFQKIDALLEEVNNLRTKNPALRKLLLDAHALHLAPKKFPYIKAFSKEREILCKERNIDRNALSNEDIQPLIRIIWEKCIPECKQEAEMKLNLVVVAGAQLSGCTIEKWTQKVNTQFYKQQDPKKPCLCITF